MLEVSSIGETLMDLHPASPIVAPRRQGSTIMNRTYDQCTQVSLESVTIAHWGWSFTFFLVGVIGNSFD
jgi:hypothetical protein